MNRELKLALQLTMVDMMSSGLNAARRNILSMGDSTKQVVRDFDAMERHLTRGLKSIAIAKYTLDKIKPGVASAADMQESLKDVEMNLMRSGKNAATLAKELQEVRRTANDVQKITPFSAIDVTHVQNKLLESGLDFNEVVGKGAGRAAMVLATITKGTPDEASDAMLNVGIPYHLKSNEYGQVADIIQRHVMSGRMKLPDLNAALPYAAPVAAAYKVPWEDMLTELAVLGEQGQLGSMAGTHLKDFWQRLTGASRITRKVLDAVNKDLVGKGKARLDFWDKKGEMLPQEQIIKNLRTSLGSYNTKQRMFILEKIFGEQGGLGALALMSKGTGSWEFVKQKTVEVASAEDKLTVSLSGLNRNVTALQGTMKSSAASIFEPWLVPLTEITKRANDAADAIGKFAERHPVATDVLNGGIAATAAALGGYGIWNLVKAGGYGRKVLSQVGLRGLLGTGVGIAEGKAIQAATGVTPVFVTNWPGNFPSAPAAPLPIPAAAKALPWAAIGGGAATFGAVAGIPLSMLISNAARENGWSSQTFSRLSREYEVMGIGGRRRDKQEIKLDLHIDSNGRVIARSNDMNTSAQVGLRRGKFFQEGP
ncbi:phage tail tape measure protein [Geomonas sp. Red32]|uniref:phage tail tape measure protein n=1 Tax=Geomonas sp. Red32 TaxID=2912856 RepID=UPI00202CE1A2|nr:phage tail tape measure protein [Geomonas sp. Red32]MCM0081774.1 phage tail tape measure protein [Geomonas sp. Red32]